MIYKYTSYGSTTFNHVFLPLSTTKEATLNPNIIRNVDVHLSISLAFSISPTHVVLV